MSHVHHDHAGHGHTHDHAHPHGHAHERHAPARHVHGAPDLSGSMLRASAAARLGVAAGLVALIWAAVFWAAR